MPSYNTHVQTHTRECAHTHKHTHTELLKVFVVTVGRHCAMVYMGGQNELSGVDSLLQP